jgi:hypothetical protein
VEATTAYRLEVGIGEWSGVEIWLGRKIFPEWSLRFLGEARGDKW